jgi:hypothetical protein
MDSLKKIIIAVGLLYCSNCAEKKVLQPICSNNCEASISIKVENDTIKSSNPQAVIHVELINYGNKKIAIVKYTNVTSFVPTANCWIVSIENALGERYYLLDRDLEKERLRNGNDYLMLEPGKSQIFSFTISFDKIGKNPIDYQAANHDYSLYKIQLTYFDEQRPDRRSLSQKYCSNTLCLQYSQ